MGTRAKTGYDYDKEAFLRDVLTTAIEAGHTYGIGYWAEVRRIHRDKDLNVLHFEVRASDDEATISQREWRTMNVPTIELAVKKILEADVPQWGKYIGQDAAGLLGFPKHCDECSLDGPLSDKVIQVATFGEIIYS